MGVYVDSSILVKLYATEPNSPVADALVLGFPAPLPLTHIQELEIRNALRLKQGRGERQELKAEGKRFSRVFKASAAARRSRASGRNSPTKIICPWT